MSLIGEEEDVFNAILRGELDRKQPWLISVNRALRIETLFGFITKKIQKESGEINVVGDISNEMAKQKFWQCDQIIQWLNDHVWIVSANSKNIAPLSLGSDDKGYAGQNTEDAKSFQKEVNNLYKLIAKLLSKDDEEFSNILKIHHQNKRELKELEEAYQKEINAIGQNHYEVGKAENIYQQIEEKKKWIAQEKEEILRGPQQIKSDLQYLEQCYQELIAQHDYDQEKAQNIWQQIQIEKNNNKLSIPVATYSNSSMTQVVSTMTNSANSLSMIQPEEKKSVSLPVVLPAERIWHVASETQLPILEEGKSYAIFPAHKNDYQKVLSFYQHGPVPGFEIGAVHVIHNPDLDGQFSTYVKLLQQRHNQPAFKAKWPEEIEAAELKEWRRKVYELLDEMAKPNLDKDYPAVKLLPMWHGTKLDILDSLFRTGYVALASTDPGFFGKGVYSAYEAEYSYRVYSKGALILNWCAVFSAYPVVGNDMQRLKLYEGKANVGNYDANFIPVIAASSKSNEVNFLPTWPSQKYAYRELTLFQYAGCFPRYLVELQATLIAPPPNPVLRFGRRDSDELIRPPSSQAPTYSSSSTANLVTNTSAKISSTITTQLPQPATTIAKTKQLIAPITLFATTLPTPSAISLIRAELTKEPTDLTLQAKLFAIIAASRWDSRLASVSTRVINLLNELRISFSGKDFRKIRIPSANLIGANLDSANCTFADFSQVSLEGAWIARTNFSNTVMRGVDFGVLPSFDLNDTETCVAFSPCGQYLAAGEGDNINIYIKVGESYQWGYALRGHMSKVLTVAFQDSKNLVSCSQNATIKLWSVTNGGDSKCIGTHILQGVEEIHATAFSQDGQLLVISSGVVASLWSAANGKRLRILEGNSNVTSVALSRDGHTVASGNQDGSIRFWSVSNGKCIRILKGHEVQVTSLAFSPDKQILASGSRDTTIKLWSVAHGKCIHTIRCGQTCDVTSVAFNPNEGTLNPGSQILAAGSGTAVRTWLVEQDKCTNIRTLQGHLGEIHSVTFSPDGQILVSGSRDKTLRFWLNSSYQSADMLYGHMSYITDIALSRSDQILASCGYDNTLKLWWAASGKCSDSIKNLDAVFSITLSADGHTLAFSHGSNLTIGLISNGKFIKSHTAVQPAAIISMAFSPDGQTLALGGKELTLWSVASGKCIHTLTGYTNAVYSVAFSPDGQTLLSAGDGNDPLRLWSVADGKCKETFKGHADTVSSVAFSSDGQTLASGSNDKTVKIWLFSTSKIVFVSITSVKCTYTLVGHEGGVTSIAFSPNGQMLVSGSEDKTFKLWRVHTGECLYTQQMPMPIRKLQFNTVQSQTYLTVAAGCELYTFTNANPEQTPLSPIFYPLLWRTGEQLCANRQTTAQNIIGLSMNNHLLLALQGVTVRASKHSPEHFVAAQKQALLANSQTLIHNLCNAQFLISAGKAVVSLLRQKPNGILKSAPLTYLLIECIQKGEYSFTRVEFNHLSPPALVGLTSGFGLFKTLLKPKSLSVDQPTLWDMTALAESGVWTYACWALSPQQHTTLSSKLHTADQDENLMLIDDALPYFQNLLSEIGLPARTLTWSDTFAKHAEYNVPWEDAKTDAKFPFQ